MRTKSILGTALGGLLLLASNASAYNASGSHCQPGNGALATYDGETVGNAGAAPGTMVCPFDPQANLGTTVQWKFLVVDQSAADFIQCTGITYDANGVPAITAVSGQSSGSSPFTQALTASVTFQTGITHSHAANCRVPALPFAGAQSQILRYELF